MPFFDENPLSRLALQPDHTDSELDLRGLSPAEALERVDHALTECRPSTRILIRFEPAGEDGRETLFLPIGRHLLAARRNGRLKHCLPIADGAGYFVETSGEN
jgi:hypothetical protein